MKRNILTLISLSFLTLNLVAQESVHNQSLSELHNEFKKQSSKINTVKKQYDDSSAQRAQKIKEAATAYQKEKANYLAAKEAYQEDETPLNEQNQKIAFNKQFESKAEALASVSNNVDNYIKYIDDISNRMTSLLIITEKSEALTAKNKLKNKNKNDIFYEANKEIVSIYNMIKDIESTSENLMESQENLKKLLVRSSEKIDANQKFEKFKKVRRIPNSSKDLLSIVVELQGHKSLALSMQDTISAIAAMSLIREGDSSSYKDSGGLSIGSNFINDNMKILESLMDDQENSNFPSENGNRKVNTSALDKKSKMFN